MLQAQNRAWGLSCRKSLVSVPKAAPLPPKQRVLVASRFRQNGGDSNTQAAPTQGSSSATLVPVVFELTKHCPFGHAFALVGDDPQLGEWDVSHALRLEWSEGDVWCGRAELPLDTPVSLKYIQVDGGGALVAWGQDIAGGSNISVMVSPSEEDTSGLTLTLDPPEAATASQPPFLSVRLEAAATLPELAAAPDEAAALQAQQQAAEADSYPLSDDTTVDTDLTDTTFTATEDTDASAVWSGDTAVQSGDGGDEDNEGMWALAAEPSAEHEEEEERQEAPWAGEDDSSNDSSEGQGQQPASSIVQQLQEGEVYQPEVYQPEEQQQGAEGWGGDSGAYGQYSGEVGEASVVMAGPEITSESVQDQGLWAEDQRGNTPGEQGGEDMPSADADADPLAAAAAAAGEEAVEQPAAAAAGVSAGGVAAGFEDSGSLGAAVEGGLMEAGDDETAAGFTGDAAAAASFQPTADPVNSGSSSSLQSHMVTSMDFEESEADDSSNDIIDNSSDIVDNSIVDSTPQELNTDQLLAVTAQESARMANTRVAGEGDDTAAASTEGAAATTTYFSPSSTTTNGSSSGAEGSEGSRQSLEGLPTPPDSNAAAVAAAMLDARNIAVPDADACRPPNPNSKIVAASPSISTVDENTPIPADRKAITEVDGSSGGVNPVDSYEDAFGALAAAAAAAAASQSLDSAQQYGREGAAQAARDREVQLVRAEEGDGEGSGTWAGGAAAVSEPPVSTGEARGGAATAGGGAGDGAVSPVDGEGTGTWTAGSGGEAGAAGSSSEGGRGRGSEEPASPANAENESGKKQNWFQRLFGGGGNDDRA